MSVCVFKYRKEQRKNQVIKLAIHGKCTDSHPREQYSSLRADIIMCKVTSTERQHISLTSKP